VGADDDVHIPFFQPFQRGLLLLGGAEAREHLDRDRVILQPFVEGLIVLLGQDGGGHQHADLLAVQGRLDCAPQGHFGLAVADVAADQSVHGARMLHVGQHIVNGRELIGGFLPGKGGLEFAVHLIGRRKGKAFADLALGVNLQQFPGQLLDVLAGLPLGFLPADPAQLVQPGLTPFRPDVTLYQAQAVHRQIQLVAAGILQQQEVAPHAGHADMLQAVITADAVVDMHHEIARLELGQGGQDLFLAHLGDAPAAHPFAEQLLLGDYDQAGIGQLEAAGEVTHQQGYCGAERKRRRINKRCLADAAGNPVGLQQILEAFGLGLLMADNTHPLAPFEPVPQGIGERGQGVGGFLGNRNPQVAVVPAGYRDGGGWPRLVQGQTRQLQAALSGDPCRKGLRLQEQLFGGGVGQAGHPPLEQAGVNLQLKVLNGRLDRLRVEQDQQGVGGILEDRFQAGVQQRLQVFDTMEIDGILQVAQDGAALVGPDVQIIAGLFQARGDIGQYLVGQQDLARRQQHQFFDGVQRTLGERIEGPHGFNAVAEKLDPHRRGGVWREDIQDAAPYRKTATVLHQGDIGIAHFDQPVQQVVPLKFFACHQITGSLVEDSAWENPLQGGGNRHDHGPGLGVVQAEEHIQAGTGNIGMGRSG